MKDKVLRKIERIDKSDYAANMNTYTYGNYTDEDKLHVIIEKELEDWERNLIIAYMEAGCNFKEAEKTTQISYYYLNKPIKEIMKKIQTAWERY